MGDGDFAFFDFFGGFLFGMKLCTYKVDFVKGYLNLLGGEWLSFWTTMRVLNTLPRYLWAFFCLEMMESVR